MSLDRASASHRHALKLALVYLLLCGLPGVLLIGLGMLKPESFEMLALTYGQWLRHVYPVTPMQVMNVPYGFVQTLALLPPLLIETLLVFLFSAWFLRRGPSATHTPLRGGWIIFILATLVWSLAIRHEVLLYLQDQTLASLRAMQDDPESNWMDKLPKFLREQYWHLSFVIYATTPLWAWLPAWLHVKLARPATNADGSTLVQDDPTVTNMAPRGTAFAAFLLGCLGMHIALVQAVYMGLWPWAADLAKVTLPIETLDSMSLPLSVSQIMLASLVCAITAAIYARRIDASRTGAFHLMFKPLLAGAGAYLLTSLILVAAAWLIAWADPGSVNALIKEFSRKLESLAPFAIALSVVAFLLLALASAGMRRAPRTSAAVLAVLVLCAALPAYVAWNLVGANLGTTGGRPGMAVTGKLDSERWRSMEQWCTGVVETRHGTWLVGRNEEDSRTPSYVPEGTPDLSKLVTGHESEDGGGFGSRPVLTTLARLQDDGTFKLAATVPDVACMAVSPQSGTLFLLTDVSVPAPPSSLLGAQSAVFRSTDHGATWQWLESGFMSDADSFASNVKPTFGTDQDVWAWGGEPRSDEALQSDGMTPASEPRHAADGKEIKPTALFYSPDQGKTSYAVHSPEPLVAPAEYLRKLLNDNMATFSDRRDMDRERYVVQVDRDRAYAWSSELIWHGSGDKRQRLLITTKADLSRAGSDGEWQITKVTRQSGIRLLHLSTSLDGKTYAILQDENGNSLARLDTQSGEWVERHKTPSLLPGWLARDKTMTRYFWSNGDYQVVSQWGDTELPRWLAPFTKKPSEIDTDAHFYTRDGGRSWHRLAIPGYLGVMGLSQQGSKLYWTKGNWYRSEEPVQWEYDLAK